ncbi:uncharacterized protein LOC111391370 isoform X1 [Olea europaea var. sylvestris]|uniref:Histone-lysine N-methyltransferase setd3 n=3 Tax=Olea europaea subsp. europaea TaxID=158383 RepID=A0A8S0SMH7_OLEEU|nr:uncharacterized protein LOC111391370 isoform X1 [Olea europaea var. sylvestris]CAA2992933.1 histone-lysine N-methyltransferase setd3 [Olea europaea subsp. europaea]
MAALEEAKLENFLQWLQVNEVELRGCKIKYCDSSKGFGIFASNDVPNGILLVVPLHLAITPTRVLQDPLFGPECKAMLEEGEVDDRFLIMLFLTVERLRKNSSWNPYLDLLPTTFGNPLWFSDDELLELKGTTLYRATELQKKSLQSLFDDKVKKLANKLLALDGNPEREVTFEDFLWANSIFWTRALNIPFPRACLFPNIPEEHDNINSRGPDASTNDISSEKVYKESGKAVQINEPESQVSGVVSTSPPGETIWVEGLVPGIDFCNHDTKPAATWEIDGTGSITGIPFSMYLLSAGQNLFQREQEISISYGDKGNEELLYLYGFVLNDNPDDFLMVHYPVDAIQEVPFSETKLQLLDAQKAKLRCLLPRSLLKHGFFSQSTAPGEAIKEATKDRVSSYSWSGLRKMPSYVSKLVFPDDFLTALRTIAMKESEIYKVSSLLEELVGSGGERQPSETEVRSAIWEACGDSGALQLLFDLINMKMMELEEGSGTKESDADLLEKARCIENLEDCKRYGTNGSLQHHLMSRNRWSSIVYRRGQKQLTRMFLKEAEHALQLALSEGN